MYRRQAERSAETLASLEDMAGELLGGLRGKSAVARDWVVEREECSVEDGFAGGVCKTDETAGNSYYVLPIEVVGTVW